ncbi:MULTISPECIES: hypothetical protein [unclassified Herbaspirillum]|uniref:hypothetical protein n=1 Tax=unclassified Herbaspirillum TaxID=2624150 RepID=UPI000E2FDD81|nr:MULTISPECIES: hypothetical protein [unclassified Herbaspirillum]RFB68599.1 hypothetical protein DZB54_15765 [Herbaspirillum sp. 3R-3a1]TFI05505.1 hypothetical protein E4P32_20440 [Herbaspirillum sp. 3R11]TFI13585.1 hypothetical protein E4P31_18155 [Herbaspirillum sp. 3R-11]TFI27109.1 hypothetical protein E4P30_10515 [Herbaspirillum sp. 3C11]
MKSVNKSRSPVKELPLDDDEGAFAATIDWRPLRNFNGTAQPTLLWATVPHATQLVEADSVRIPGLESIGARHAENRMRRDSGSPLGSKVFWEEFRRSRLVILFDRHSDRKLLHRLREELEPGIARSLQTLIVLTGKDDKSYCTPLAKNIQEVLLKGNPLKFHYIEGMESSKSPFPHDRFAVTDGEFWHFGGSVGSVEQCLTGFSRGWKAKDLGVNEFIEATLAAAEQWSKK